MNILIIDIETTGFLNQGGKIVEIGIVDLNLLNGHKEIIFNEVCHEKGITMQEIESSWIVQNSDLTVNAVKFSSSLSSKFNRIQKIIDHYPLGATAFNNAFDFGFLENRGFKFPKKLGCPMLLSTGICKLPPKNGGNGFKWPTVEEAHHYFFGDVGFIEKHRGADDAFHEADIVYKLYNLGIFTL